MGGSGRDPGPAPTGSRKTVLKKFENVRELGSNQTMATIYAFGPFRLDAEAEILFRGAEPTALGRRAVAVLRVLVERAGAPVSKDMLIETAWSGGGGRGEQPAGPDRGPAQGAR
jgi:DNA-binding response OmpR family regulator